MVKITQMYKATAYQEINAPAEKVWAVIDDFGNMADFHPFLKSSLVINDLEKGMGARRSCTFYGGNSLNETLIRYEPGKGYSVSLEDFSVPWEKSCAHMDVVPISESKSLVSFSIEFVPKFGEFGSVMGLIMMEPLTKWWVHQVLKGLDTHVTTGKIVGEDSFLLQVFLWGFLFYWLPDFTKQSSGQKPIVN